MCVCEKEREAERQRDRGERMDYRNLEIDSESICGFAHACGLTACRREKPFLRCFTAQSKIM